jgi:hypothetical protein
MEVDGELVLRAAASLTEEVEKELGEEDPSPEEAKKAVAENACTSRPG